jgi:hypothetical protein
MLALVGGVLTSLPACAKKDQTPELVKGQTVRGKVTYNGRPVPYGLVLFYSYEKSIDPYTGLYQPTGIGEIRADGTYEVSDAAAGPAMVCVAADPDADLGSLTLPAAMLGLDQSGAAGGRPTGAIGGPPIGPPGGRGGPSIRPPGIPPMGPSHGPAKGPVGGPPVGPPIKPPNPLADNLSAEDKKMLKEIHAKYGIVGKSPLGYPVREGDQIYDIKLVK